MVKKNSQLPRSTASAVYPSCSLPAMPCLLFCRTRAITGTTSGRQTLPREQQATAKADAPERRRDERISRRIGRCVGAPGDENMDDIAEARRGDQKAGATARARRHACCAGSASRTGRLRACRFATISPQTLGLARWREPPLCDIFRQVVLLLATKSARAPTRARGAATQALFRDGASRRAERTVAPALGGSRLCFCTRGDAGHEPSIRKVNERGGVRRRVRRSRPQESVAPAVDSVFLRAAKMGSYQRRMTPRSNRTTRSCGKNKHRPPRLG